MSVDFIDHLHRVQMVCRDSVVSVHSCRLRDGCFILTHSRIDANLVHDRDSSFLDFFLKLLHCRRDVAGRDNILLVADSALDDVYVECVGDETDDYVNLLYSFIEGR